MECPTNDKTSDLLVKTTFYQWSDWGLGILAMAELGNLLYSVLQFLLIPNHLLIQNFSFNME